MIYYIQNRGIMSFGNPFWYTIWFGKQPAVGGIFIKIIGVGGGLIHVDRKGLVG